MGIDQTPLPVKTAGNANAIHPGNQVTQQNIENIERQKQDSQRFSQRKYRKKKNKQTLFVFKPFWVPERKSSGKPEEEWVKEKYPGTMLKIFFFTAAHTLVDPQNMHRY